MRCLGFETAIVDKVARGYGVVSERPALELAGQNCARRGSAIGKAAISRLGSPLSPRSARGGPPEQIDYKASVRLWAETLVRTRVDN